MHTSPYDTKPLYLPFPFQEAREAHYAIERFVGVIEESLEWEMKALLSATQDWTGWSREYFDKLRASLQREREQLARELETLKFTIYRAAFAAESEEHHLERLAEQQERESYRFRNRIELGNND